MRDRRGRSAARHGRAGRGGRGDPARAALERPALGRCRRRADRRARRPGLVGGATRAACRPPSFTVTKLRWLATHEPASAARRPAVLLPHDWLTWRLRGGGPGDAPCPARDLVTDRGDASGTGYFSTPAGTAGCPTWPRPRSGTSSRLPRVARPGETVGETAVGRGLSAGTGDNMAAALGLGLEPGELAVSIGTSGTAFAVSAVPADDAVRRGVPASPTPPAGSCRWSARSTRAWCWRPRRRCWAPTSPGSGRLALAAEPGAGGITLLPYLDGERTPDRPDRHRRAARPDHPQRHPGEPGQGRGGGGAGLAGRRRRPDRAATAASWNRVLLIGGGARSRRRPRARAGHLRPAVEVPEPEEYVALGAARQAAWALAGGAAPPVVAAADRRRRTPAPPAEIRERHAALRDDTATWKEGTDQ